MNATAYLAGYVALLIMFFVWVVMQWFGKTPSVQDWAHFLDTFNGKGGNILLLALFSFGFFKASFLMFFWSMERVIEGKMTPDNAVMMMGLQFVTGAAFGGAFSAMLKTMTADSGRARATDPPPTVVNNNGGNSTPAGTQ